MITLSNAIFNLFSTPQTPIADSYAVSTARSANTSYGSIRLFGSIGFALGSYIGGLYVAYFSVQTLWLPFFILGLLGTATALSFPQRRVSMGAPVSLHHGLHVLLRNRKFVVFLVAGFLLSQTLTAFNTYFALTFQSIGGSLALTGIAFFLASASNVPGMLLAARVMRKMGRERVLMVASVVYAVRWGVQALIPIPTVAIAIQILQGLSFGFYYVVAVDYVSDAAQKELQATAQSIFGMVCGCAAGICGNLLNGFLLHFGGPELMYGACTISAMRGSGLLLELGLRRSQNFS